MDEENKNAVNGNEIDIADNQNAADERQPNSTAPEELAKTDTPGTDNAEPESPKQNSNLDFDLDSFFEGNKDKVKSVLRELIQNSPEISGYKEALDERSAQLDEREKQLNFMKLQMDTLKELDSRNISASMMTIILGADLELTIKNIEIFSKVHNEAVHNEVAKKLVGKTPSAGNGNMYSGIETGRKQVKKIINRG